MHAPFFWRQKHSVMAALLSPLASIYENIARKRWKNAQPEKLSVPVMCIGNLVAGGAGKTPVAEAILHLLKQSGKQPHLLSRGYGGSLAGDAPVKVDLQNHTAKQVGDEPLMLAQHFPVWIGKDRVATAKAAINAGADCLVMDDGFQNPSLHKDCALLVIDGAYGLGNAKLLPAGPLREKPEQAFQRAQAVILLGEDAQGIAQMLPPQMPLFTADILPLSPEGTQKQKGAYVAFAGIGRPEKFFFTLRGYHGNLVEMIGYGDHHVYSKRDIAHLASRAAALNAKLITTRKDWVRLPEPFRTEVDVLDVRAAFRDEPAFRRWIMTWLA